MEDLLMAW